MLEAGGLGFWRLLGFDMVFGCFEGAWGKGLWNVTVSSLIIHFICLQTIFDTDVSSKKMVVEECLFIKNGGDPLQIFCLVEISLLRFVGRDLSSNNFWHGCLFKKNGGRRMSLHKKWWRPSPNILFGRDFSSEICWSGFVFWRDIRVKNCLKTNPDQKISEEKSLPNKIFGEGLHHFLWRDILLPHFFLKRHPCQKLFEDKSRPTNLRREISTKQNIWRGSPPFFMKRHSSTTFFFEETSVSKIVWRQIPTNKSQKRNLYQTKYLERVSTIFYEETFFYHIFFWRDIRVKNCLKTNPDQQISEEKSLPNKIFGEGLHHFLWRDILLPHFFLKRHPCQKLFEDKSRPTNLRREISTKQNIWRGSPPFFMKRHSSTTFFFEETSVSKIVWRQIPTNKSQKRNLYQTKYLERVSTIFYEETFFYHIFFWRDIRVKNCLKTNPDQQISEEKSLPNKIFGEGLHHFLWRDILLPHFFLKRHPCQKLFEDKSRPKNLRREISTKQNIWRGSPPFFMKRHSSTTFFFEETSVSKIVWRQIPTKKSQKRNLYQTKYLERVSTIFYEETFFYHIFFWRDIRVKNCLKTNPDQKSQKRNLYQTKYLERVSTIFYEETFFYHIFFWRDIRVKNCLKTNPDQKISEEKSLPNKIFGEGLHHFLWRDILLPHFFLKRHPCQKLFEDKSRPKNLRREISTKQNIWRGSPPFFMKRHSSTTFFFEETSVSKIVWRQIPTNKSQKRNLYQTKYLERVSTIFYEETFFYHIFFWRDIRVKNCLKTNPDQQISEEKSLPNKIFGEGLHHFLWRDILLPHFFLKRHPCQKLFEDKSRPKISEEKSLPNKIFGEGLHHFLWRDILLPHFFLKRHPCQKLFEDKSRPKNLRREISTKQNIWRGSPPFFMKRHSSTTFFFEETSVSKIVWRQIPTKKSQKRNLYQTKYLERVSTIFYEETFFYHIFFWRDIRVKNCLKTNPDQQISEEKSLPNKIFGEGLHHFLWRDILLPHFFLKRHPCQKLFEDKSRPTNLRREISTKQNIWRGSPPFFMKRHSSTTFFFEETSVSKIVWRQIPTKKSQKRNLYQTKYLERVSTIFYEETFFYHIFFWRDIRVKNCLKTNPDQQISEEKSLPNKIFGEGLHHFLWRDILLPHFFLKRHPCQKLFEDKSRPTNLRREISTKQNIWRGSPPFFMKRHSSTTFFFEETSVSKIVWRQIPTNKSQKRNLYQTKYLERVSTIFYEETFFYHIFFWRDIRVKNCLKTNPDQKSQKRNLYQTKYLERVSTIFYEETFFYHIFFWRDIRVKNCLKTNPDQQISEEKSLPNKIFGEGLHHFLWRDILLPHFFLKRHPCQKLFEDKSRPTNLRREISTKQNIWRGSPPFFMKRHSSTTFFFEETSVSKIVWRQIPTNKSQKRNLYQTKYLERVSTIFYEETFFYHIFFWRDIRVKNCLKTNPDQQISEEKSLPNKIFGEGLHHFLWRDILLPHFFLKRHPCQKLFEDKSRPTNLRREISTKQNIWRGSPPFFMKRHSSTTFFFEETSVSKIVWRQIPTNKSQKRNLYQTKYLERVSTIFYEETFFYHIFFWRDIRVKNCLKTNPDQQISEEKSLPNKIFGEGLHHFLWRDILLPHFFLKRHPCQKLFEDKSRPTNLRREISTKQNIWRGSPPFFMKRHSSTTFFFEETSVSKIVWRQIPTNKSQKRNLYQTKYLERVSTIFYEETFFYHIFFWRDIRVKNCLKTNPDQQISEEKSLPNKIFGEGLHHFLWRDILLPHFFLKRHPCQKLFEDKSRPTNLRREISTKQNIWRGSPPFFMKRHSSTTFFFEETSVSKIVWRQIPTNKSQKRNLYQTKYLERVSTIFYEETFFYHIFFWRDIRVKNCLKTNPDQQISEEKSLPNKIFGEGLHHFLWRDILLPHFFLKRHPCQKLFEDKSRPTNLRREISTKQNIWRGSPPFFMKRHSSTTFFFEETSVSKIVWRQIPTNKSQKRNLYQTKYLERVSTIFYEETFFYHIFFWRDIRVKNCLKTNPDQQISEEKSLPNKIFGEGLHHFLWRDILLPHFFLKRHPCQKLFEDKSRPTNLRREISTKQNIWRGSPPFFMKRHSSTTFFFEETSVSKIVWRQIPTNKSQKRNLYQTKYLERVSTIFYEETFFYHIFFWRDIRVKNCLKTNPDQQISEEKSLPNKIFGEGLHHFLWRDILLPHFFLKRHPCQKLFEDKSRPTNLRREISTKQNIWRGSPPFFMKRHSSTTFFFEETSVSKIVWRQIPTNKSQKRNLYQTKYLERVSTIFYEETFFYHIFFWRDIRVKNCLKTNPDQQISEEKSLPNKIFGEGLHHFLWRDILLPHFFLKRHPCQKLFEDKSRPTNLRREISTKQNIWRGSPPFFMKRHSSTTFFFEETSVSKIVWRQIPTNKSQKRNLYQTKYLERVSTIFYEETFFYHIFFWRDIPKIVCQKLFEDKSRPTNLRREISTKQNIWRGSPPFFMKRHSSTTFFFEETSVSKIVWRQIPTNKSQKRNLYQTKYLERVSTIFYEETFFYHIFFWRDIRVKNCLKTNPDQQISEEKSLPNKIFGEGLHHFLWRDILLPHFFLKRHPCQKLFEDKSRPTNLRREISTKQNIWRGSPPFFMKRHSSTTFFFEETSVSKIVWRQIPTNKSQKRNLYQTKYLERVSTIFYEETFFYHIFFWRDIRVKNCLKTNPDQTNCLKTEFFYPTNKSQKRNLYQTKYLERVSTIFYEETFFYHIFFWRDIRVKNCLKTNPDQQISEEKSLPNKIFGEGLHHFLWRDILLPHFFLKRHPCQKLFEDKSRPTNKSQKRNLYQTKYLERVSTIFYEETFFYHIFFWRDIRVKNCLKTNPDQQISEEKSLPNKIFGEGLHHFLWRDILLPHFFLKRHPCQKLFEDKSRPTNLRREISTKQNIWRGSPPFFMKRHSSTTFFFEETSVSKNCWRQIKNSEEKSLPNKIFGRQIPTNKSQKRNLYQTKYLERVSTIFYEETFFYHIFFWRDIRVKNCLKTNPDQQISEEKSLPNKIFGEGLHHFLWRDILLPHFFLKRHPCQKLFEDKSRPTNLRREISTKQNIWRGSPPFFMKRHSSTTFFFEETSVSKIVWRQIPTNKSQKRNLYQTKYLERVSTIFYEETFFYHIFFWRDIRVKNCLKTNPDQQISEEKSLPNKIFGEGLHHFLWRDILLPHFFLKRHPCQKLFEDKSRPTNLRREISTKQNIWRGSPPFFMKRHSSTTFFFEETSVSKIVWRQIPTNKSQKRNLYQTKYLERVSTIFYEETFFYHIFFWRDIRVKNCLKTNPDQQISEEKSLPNKIFGEGLHHFLWRDILLPHFFLKRHPCQKLFEDKSRPTNLRREISTKQNIWRGSPPFFMKRHSSTTFFFEETSVSKIVWRQIPTNKSQKRNLYQTKYLERVSTIFYEETFFYHIFFWRDIRVKNCLKTNPDQQISEEKSLPNKIFGEGLHHFLWRDILLPHFFLKRHPCQKLFEDKSRPTNLRREISTKQNIWRGSPPFFMKRHSSTTFFFEETSVSKIVWRQIPTNKSQKRNLYQTKYLERVSTIFYEETFFYHIFFWRDIRVKNCLKTNPRMSLQIYILFGTRLANFSKNFW